MLNTVGSVKVSVRVSVHVCVSFPRSLAIDHHFRTQESKVHSKHNQKAATPHVATIQARRRSAAGIKVLSTPQKEYRDQELQRVTTELSKMKGMYIIVSICQLFVALSIFSI